MKTISLLEPSDLAAAYHIETASHAFPWTEKTFYSNQGNAYYNLKLEDDGKLIGFAITQKVLDEATLFNIALHPDYQRQGLGEYLLEKLLSDLQAQKVMTVWLEVRVSNHAAIALYHKLGFNEITTRPDYYPTKNGKEDALIMAWYSPEFGF